MSFIKILRGTWETMESYVQNKNKKEFCFNFTIQDSKNYINKDIFPLAVKLISSFGDDF